MGEEETCFFCCFCWFGKTKVFCLHTFKGDQNHVVHSQKRVMSWI